MFVNLDTSADPLLSDLVQRMLSQGAQPDDLPALLEKVIPGALPKAGACLLKGLKAAAAGMLSDRRSIQDRFQRRLRRKWRKPFDLLRVLLEAARESGEEVNSQYRPVAVANQDCVFEALVRLHARACLVSGEVLCLMEAGFASGALARWRTLHEIAVVAYFIDQHGQAVAEQYLLHHVIQSHRAAGQYQEHCKALGQPPISNKELRRLKTNRDALCSRFGNPYAEEWGWAASVLGNRRPNFADIERAVTLKHMRPYFQLACHSTHAGSKGIHFDLGNALAASGQAIALAGPSDAGHFDPGTRTAVSLLQVTTALLFHATPTIMGLVLAQALLHLRNEIEQAFAMAEAKLEQEARKVQQRRIHNRRLERDPR